MGYWKGQQAIQTAVMAGLGLITIIVLVTTSLETIGNVGFKGNNTAITTTQYNNETLAATLVNVSRNLTNTNATSGALSTIIDRVLFGANRTEGAQLSASLFNFTLNRTPTPNTITFNDIGWANNSVINITYTVNVTRAQPAETGANYSETTRSLYTGIFGIAIVAAFIMMAFLVLRH